ncbi:MAG: glycosyltransferase family 4 protein [Alteraurantiacibacter sp.]
MTRRSILFCMRFADDQGFVWRTVVDLRDRVARLLPDYDCFVAFPKLTGNTAHAPKHLQPVELDCYRLSNTDKRALGSFVERSDTAAMVYMSALPTTLDMRFLRSLGVATINTEEDSFDHSQHDGLPKRLAKFVTRRLLKRQLHTLHIANSPSQGVWLRSYACIPDERLIVIPNGIDTERFSPAERTEHEDLHVLCAGQARSEKRIDTVIRCAARIFAQPEFDGTTFTYVGDGPMMVEWQAEADRLGLRERFLFAGAQADLVPVYRASDIFVHAAERESFGLVIAEAMACGLPVVASAAAGPSEIVEDGATGALIPVEDEHAFQAAIESYLRDPARIRAHGHAARERAVEHYAMERQAHDMAAAIRSAIED